MSTRGLASDDSLGHKKVMSAMTNVAIDASQFPAAVLQDLLTSLRTRQVNHKFHYDSVKQTQKWLALHAAFSPSRTDPDCAATYDAAFREAAASLDSTRVRLVSLGCGGGQKDLRLLTLLNEADTQASYVPSDVSVAMVLTARALVETRFPRMACWPFVCDLARSDTLPEMLRQVGQPQSGDRTARLVTFFGMIPNFEPSVILPRLAGLLRKDDSLLFSANLAPGRDYTKGVRGILPLYDNELTREWLMTFLLDLGVERKDGELRFSITEGEAGLKRVTAVFHFVRKREVRVDNESFKFAAGDAIRLFFSYRHTPKRVRDLLLEYGLEVRKEWITKSREEGVFLVRRTG